jgi:hypothetical protein
MNEWQKFEARQRDRLQRDIAIGFFIAGFALGGLIVWIF